MFRAQIICDVFHLASHGQLDTETRDRVLLWYHDHRETDFAPIRAYRECFHAASQCCQNEFNN